MASDDEYDFTTELWLWEGKAAWHFVTVPEEISDEIEFRTSDVHAGFGSVRVEVTIGTSTWRTSVFPDTKRGAYILPVKKQVRQRESLDEGDSAEVHLVVLPPG